MLDLSWSEILVIAIVLIVVVGPKDLPRLLRSVGRTTSQMRKMAGDFRKQFDEALKEAELDDIKNLANDARKLNPASDIKRALNPFEQAAKDVRAGLDGAMKPKKSQSSEPASSVARPAEPLKAGATGEAAAPRIDPAAPAAKPGVKSSESKSTSTVTSAPKAGATRTKAAPKPKAAARPSAAAKPSAATKSSANKSAATGAAGKTVRTKAGSKSE